MGGHMGADPGRSSGRTDSHKQDSAQTINQVPPASLLRRTERQS